MENKRSAKTMVLLAMLSAIIAILGFTPLGMIPLGLFNVTLLHIPVIIGACILGTKSGAFLGFIFGLVSFINNSFLKPTPVSFVFSPFYAVGDVKGNVWSLVVVFVPRILLGIFAALLYKRLKNKSITKAGIAAGAAGSLINTVFVFGFIFLFFRESYESVLGKTMFAVIQASVITNSIPEIIAAVILVPMIVRPLEKIRVNG